MLQCECLNERSEVRTVSIEKQVTNFVMLLSIKIDGENTPSCAQEVPWEPCNEKKRRRIREVMVRKKRVGGEDNDEEGEIPNFLNKTSHNNVDSLIYRN